MEDLLNEAVSGSEDTSVAVEKPVSIRDSLKAAMDDTPKDAAADGRGNVNRDEGGRFAPKPVEAAKVEPQQTPVAAQQPVEAKVPDPVTPQQPAAKAPPGWSPEAKASFETLPPHVQAAVAKREQEVENGFKVLQDYKGLEEFTPMVRQAGTSHAEVMRRAVSWEKSLQTDPINTVLNAARLGGVNIIELAQRLQSGQVPQLRQQPQQQVQQPNVQAEVERVLRQKDTERQLSEFFADPAHSHANDESVANHMAALIKGGMATSLQEAYDMATWARPDIRAQLISQQAPAPVVDPAKKAAAVNQARQASRSITGSSAPGASNNGAKEAPQDIRGSLRAAYRAASSGGSV